AVYGVDNKARVKRLVEWIAVLKRLWTEEDVTFEGQHCRFAGVTIEPKPAARPRPPIWIANNAGGERAAIERTLRRVVRHADGWRAGRRPARPSGAWSTCGSTSGWGSTR